MANTRRILKPYKGFEIVKINNYRYIGSAEDGTQIEAYSLKELKAAIDLHFMEMAEETTGGSEGILLGVTLLSVEEAGQVPKVIRRFNDWWWLRSPGRDIDYAASVRYDGCVDEYGALSSVYYDYACVRPALHLESDVSNLKDGDRIKIGSYEFDVVCNGKYALCTTSIGKSAFRTDWEVEDANNYEVSDIKKVVDKWYKEKIKGMEIEVINLSSDMISYTIYQIRKDLGEDVRRDISFESLSHLKKRGLSVDSRNYEKVYSGKIDGAGKDVDAVLEGLFEMFNINHPSDFRGHSLSVSDVIVLERNGIKTAYFVGSFGFEKVPEFLKVPEEKEAKEKQEEDGMIFLLNTCNEWKEWSSMRLVCVTTKVPVLIGRIKGLLKQGDAEFVGYEGKKAVKEFEAFVDGIDADSLAKELNDRLDYAYVGAYLDGEGD